MSTKNSIDVALAENGRENEVRCLGTIGGGMAAWSYRFPARVSRRLRDSQETLPQSVLEIAWKAQVRLCARYQRLIAKGEQSQIAVTAVARELAAFMRVIARTVLVPV